MQLKTRSLGPPHFYRQVLTFAVPVMIQTLIQSLISLIDNFMVGGLGDIKMSAVNISNEYTFLFLTTLGTFAETGGMFMSQFNGAKDKVGMQQTYRFKQIMMLSCAVLFTLFSHLFSGTILGFLVHGNRNACEIVQEGQQYLHIILLTFIPIAFSTGLTSSLRDIGSVRVIMYCAIFCTLVNTTGNYMLIYGNWGAPRLEVKGAAYATLIARCTELCIMFVYVRSKRCGFYVRIVELWKVQRQQFMQILRKLGLVFVSDMSWICTETIVVALYNSRGGAEVVSGMAAGWAIANIFFLIFPVIFTCVRIVIGSSLGQNKLNEARQQARWFFSGFFIFGFFLGVCAALSVVIIPFVFTQLSPASHIITRNLVWVIAAYMPLWTCLNTQLAISRAGGDAKLGAWVDVSVNSTVFLPCMIGLTFWTALSPVLMFALAKLSDFLKLLIARNELKKERWVKNLTVL